MAVRPLLLLVAVLLAASCAEKKDTDKIERRHQDQMIRMG